MTKEVDMINYYGNELTWVPNLNGYEGPMYQRMATAIEKDIQSGKLLHGAKMPPQRILAGYLEINHGTVTRAYKLCEEKGLLKGVIGKGTFVSGSAGLPVDLLTDYDNSQIISLGMTLPLYELNDRLKLALSEMSPSFDYNIALKYCPPEGHIKHRYIAANWLKKQGISVNVENLIISSGTQNALAMVLITLFQKGDRLAVNEYTYTGLKSLAKYLGIILVPIKSIDFELDLEDLNLALKRENIKGIYLMPDCHNPSAKVMTEATRREIAAIVERHQLLCIEDATYSFTMKTQITPISAMVPDRSFYIYGTSKAISPSFRISYVVSPKKYVKKLQQGLNNLTWMASPFTAELLSLLQSTGQYEEFVDMKLAELEERNALFDQIFKGYTSPENSHSMFRSLILDKNYNEILLEKKGLEKEVQFFGINRFYVGTGTEVRGIRLSISSPKNLRELEQGLLVVKSVIEDYEEDYDLVF